jgi:hypothetical protein
VVRGVFFLFIRKLMLMSKEYKLRSECKNSLMTIRSSIIALIPVSDHLSGAILNWARVVE